MGEERDAGAGGENEQQEDWMLECRMLDRAKSRIDSYGLSRITGNCVILIWSFDITQRIQRGSVMRPIAFEKLAAAAAAHVMHKQARRAGRR
jgi:hypothetical protein